MKNFYKTLVFVSAAMLATSASAQVRWCPADWQVVDGNNTQLLDKDHEAVKVTPVTGKDHCHIHNAVDLTFSANEPYLIIHFEAAQGVRGHKGDSYFKFYNNFDKYNELTAEQIASYNGYVFDEAFNVDKSDDYVVYRGKYADTDDDIFTNGRNAYDKPVGRGNIWVIDLRKVPTKNGGFIFDKENVQAFSITHTRKPWYTNVEGTPTVNGEPVHMQSALQIEICANSIPAGEDKAAYLADKWVEYRYIATASAAEIEKEEAGAPTSRANSDKIDIDKVRALIDTYHKDKYYDENYRENRPEEGGTPAYIDAIDADNGMKFAVYGTAVTCDGAAEIALYNIAGAQVAAAAGNTVEATHGIYIAKATAADGTVAIAKVIIK